MSNDNNWDKREKLAMILLGVAAEVVIQDLANGMSSMASVGDPKSIPKGNWRGETVQLAQPIKTPTKTLNIDTSSTKEKKQ
jgi:hypothetical protein